MSNKPNILLINMAKSFGGGEFYTEQLIQHLDGFHLYFLGKKSGILKQHIQTHFPHIKTIHFFDAIKLALSDKQLIVHALDGRGAHFAGLLKRWFKTKSVITRQVNFPLKRSSSQKTYAQADMLVGVSQQISHYLSTINPNVRTVYPCIKPLQENLEFEQHYFSQQNNRLKIAHIGHFQTVKNFPLTITLAKQNPNIQFYLIGSGLLEQELKNQAAHLDNVIFIPFTPYIGSVFKQIDLLIVPSHNEGLGMVILEAYQHHIPVIAHSIGGIPEIVEDKKTGFLIKPNTPENHQIILDKITRQPEILHELKHNIAIFLTKHPFSASKMAQEYTAIYQHLLGQKK